MTTQETKRSCAVFRDNMKDTILFDLDGTLTDSAPGILSCVRFALSFFGIEESDADLMRFVGPPLEESFQQFYGFSREDALLGVEKYRARYEAGGIFENSVYAGIQATLAMLKEKGMRLAVASSKPQVYVDRVLEHFDLAKYFDVVVGGSLDSSRIHKKDVMAEALRLLYPNGSTYPVERMYMVGDRKYDMEGAAVFGIESIGVAYGYGDVEELLAAGADYVVRDVAGLYELLAREAEELERACAPQKLFFAKAKIIGAAVVLFWLGRIVSWYAGMYLLQMLGLESITTARTVLTAVSYTCGGAAIFPLAKKEIKEAKIEGWLSHLHPLPALHYSLLSLLTLCMALGCNLLAALLDAAAYDASYETVTKIQFAAGFRITLLCLGILSPIAEELLFRGILYNSIKKLLNPKVALVLSALLFGIYHMNLVQGLYAFVMGLLMAYAYERFGSFFYPVAMHIFANIIGCVLSYTTVGYFLLRWPICIGLFLVAAVCMTVLLLPVHIKGVLVEDSE